MAWIQWWPQCCLFSYSTVNDRWKINTLVIRCHGRSNGVSRTVARKVCRLRCYFAQKPSDSAQRRSKVNQIVSNIRFCGTGGCDTVNDNVRLPVNQFRSRRKSKYCCCEVWWRRQWQWCVVQRRSSGYLQTPSPSCHRCIVSDTRSWIQSLVDSKYCPH